MNRFIEGDRVRLVRDIGERTKAGTLYDKLMPYCYTVINVRRNSFGQRMVELSKQHTGKLEPFMSITEELLERSDRRTA